VEVNRRKGGNFENADVQGGQKKVAVGPKSARVFKFFGFIRKPRHPIWVGIKYLFAPRFIP